MRLGNPDYFLIAVDLLNQLEIQFQELNESTHNRERFNYLKQTGTVAEYTNQFLSLVLLIDSTNQEKLFKYRNGLKSPIQIELLRYPDIDDVAELARLADSIEQRFNQ